VHTVFETGDEKLIPLPPEIKSMSLPKPKTRLTQAQDGLAFTKSDPVVVTFTKYDKVSRSKGQRSCLRPTLAWIQEFLFGGTKRRLGVYVYSMIATALCGLTMPMMPMAPHVNVSGIFSLFFYN
jgi:hypothetical protein